MRLTYNRKDNSPLTKMPPEYSRGVFYYKEFTIYN